MDELTGPDGGRDLGQWGHTVMSGYDDAADAYDANRTAADEVAFVESLVADLSAAAASTASGDSSGSARPEWTDGVRVLDAGCGGGRAVLDALSEEYETVGVDLSAEQLALASERAPAARLIRGDLTRLPVADDAVDALTALHSVIHVPREHHGSVFAEFARVVRPGGRLLLTTGVGEWEGANDDWLDSGAEMQWSFHGREESLALLADAGYAVENDTVVSDELGGGEWLFVRARLRE